MIFNIFADIRAFQKSGEKAQYSTEEHNTVKCQIFRTNQNETNILYRASFPPTSIWHFSRQNDWLAQHSSITLLSGNVPAAAAVIKTLAPKQWDTALVCSQSKVLLGISVLSIAPGKWELYYNLLYHFVWQMAAHRTFILATPPPAQFIHSLQGGFFRFETAAGNTLGGGGGCFSPLLARQRFSFSPYISCPTYFAVCFPRDCRRRNRRQS